MDKRLSAAWLTLIISMLLPPVSFGLWALGLQRMLGLLRRLPTRPRPAAPPEQERLAQRYGQRMRWIKRRGLIRGNCLSQSVLLWWLLRRRGIETQLRIGARQHHAEFQAHAWVEYRGRPLNAGPRVRQKYNTFGHAFGDQIS